MATTKSRMVWMDFARGLAILLVILVHATALAPDHGLTVPNAVWVFNNLFDPYRMPMLMFLSGMLLHRGLEKPAPVYLWGKFALIYWPFLIWSAVTLAATDIGTLRRYLLMPLTSPTYLWYLWFITAYYVIALVLTRLRAPLLAVAVVSLIAVDLVPDIQRSSRFCYLFVFFLAGHLYATHRPDLSRLFWPAVALVLTGAAISAFAFRIKYDPLYVWAPLALIAVVVTLGPRHVPGRLSAPVEWVGRNSLVFYVTHLSVLYLTQEALAKAGFWIAFTASTLVALVVASAFQLGRERLGLVKALFEFPYPLVAGRPAIRRV